MKKEKKDNRDPVSVLLVDDDEDEYILTRDLLGEVQNRRFQVEWVDSYGEALEALREGAHDAYLIDYRLGAHTGMELLGEMKKEGLSMASILLTGQGDERIDNLALEMGAFDYLVKGEFSAAVLDRAIRYAIERERTGAKLRFQAEILRSVHDAVFCVSKDGTILDWNEGARRIFGLTEAEALGRPVRELCPAKEDKHFENRIVPQVLRNGKAEEMIQCRSRAGEEIYIRAKITPMTLGRVDGYVFCASDITNEKRLEAEIVRISEREQQRIGQDIHDDLCSQLSGIGCLTKVLEQQLVRNRRDEAELMGKVTQMVADAGVKAREIARGLVPTVLETQGLGGAVEELVARQREMFGVDCTTSISEADALRELNQDASVQLYRIVQEALTNAIKHSDADRIEVSTKKRGMHLEVRIRDDGKGMCPLTVTAGMGLLTMRRRAEIIGADFNIHASPGEGTEISFLVPLARKSELAVL